MSDPIKGRFGWYRQVNGGNFYMSVKQVFQAEKKIRSLSLLQQHALVKATELDQDTDSSEITDDHIYGKAATETSNEHKDVEWLREVLSSVSLDDLSDNDANVAFFVSGYIGRSISRQRKCAACKELLVDAKEPCNINDSLPEDHKQLFLLADRGGLSAPTEYTYCVTALSVQYYTAINTDVDAKRKLFASSNQRRDFILAMSKVLLEHKFEMIINQKCSSGK